MRGEHMVQGQVFHRSCQHDNYKHEQILAEGEQAHNTSWHLTASVLPTENKLLRIVGTLTMSKQPLEI